MKASDGAASHYQKFLKRILNNPPQRRYLLQQWHSAKTTPQEEERLAVVFETFIHTVLFQPIQFRLLPDRFYLFQGTNLPVFFNWISSEDQSFLITCMAQRTALFGKRNEYLNNQFDYTEFAFDYQIPIVWRQQLVRDFVWMVSSKQENYFTTELIAAVQWIRLQQKENVFLKHIHSGLQKQCVLEEVLCII